MSTTAQENKSRKLKIKTKYKVRSFNRCSLCGRRRGYIRYFKLCRLCFRKLANKGELPGVSKSSW